MLTISIQAGGESKRMGMDKGLILFQGIPMIQRIITRLSPLADEMIIISNQPQKYGFTGLQIFQDTNPGRGPLGGLYTALKMGSQPLVAVIGCDMPFVNPGLLEYQAEIAAHEEIDVVIPLISGKYEPFHAVYRRETCLSAVKNVMETNQLKMVSWLSMVKVHTINQDKYSLFDPQNLAFTNINTPQDLIEAENIAGGRNEPG